MSEQPSGLSSKRKLWIGAGVAAVAIVVAARYFDLPPSHDMSGTIAPANRSVAAQPGAGDVNGTSTTDAQTTQNGVVAGSSDSAARDAAGRADSAARDAAARDSAARDAAARSDSAGRPVSQ